VAFVAVSREGEKELRRGIAEGGFNWRRRGVVTFLLFLDTACSLHLLDWVEAH
jgi:hypothetical protein